MGNLLGGGGSMTSYGYGSQSQCCEPKVDPISLIATIGSIAALSLWMRQAVIDFMIKGARKRKSLNQLDFIAQGNVDSTYSR